MQLRNSNVVKPEEEPLVEPIMPEEPLANFVAVLAKGEEADAEVRNIGGYSFSLYLS